MKASLVDAKDLFANAIKVVTERGVVYLMGRVTEREATRATEIARGVSGVRQGGAGVRDRHRGRARQHRSRKSLGQAGRARAASAPVGRAAAPLSAGA